VAGLTGSQSAAAFKTGLSLVKGDVGLGSVDNTSDANKPVSTAAQTALNAKAGTGAVTASGLTMTTARLLGRTTASTGAIEELTAASAKTFLAITASDVSSLGYFATGTDAANLTGTVAAARMPALTGDVTTTVGTAATTIANDAVTLAKMANVATGTVFYRKTAGTGDPEVQTLATLKADLGLTGTNSGDQTITLSGDVSGSGTGAITVTIGANKVTFSKFVAATGAGIVGATAAGNFSQLSGTQTTALLDTFTSALKGLAPASGGGTANFLRADGSWAAPPGTGGGLADGDYGDVVVSGGATAMTVESAAGNFTVNGTLVASNSQFVDGGLSIWFRDPSFSARGKIGANGSGWLRVNADTLKFLDLADAVTFGTLTSSALAMSVPVTAPNIPTEITLTADSATTSASFADVTDGTNILKFTPAANSAYECQAVLLLQTATATILPRLGVHVLAQGAGSYGSAQIDQTGATTATRVTADGTWTTAAVDIQIAAGGFAAANTPYMAYVTIRGFSGASPAAISIQLASETAGTSVRVLKGSQLRYKNS
jgi:hypothetical protein